MAFPDAVYRAAAEALAQRHPIWNVELAESDARAALEAAMPAIREHIAQEIQDYADGVPRTTTDPNAYARMAAYENAARMVRGGTP